MEALASTLACSKTLISRRIETDSMVPKLMKIMNFTRIIGPSMLLLLKSNMRLIWAPTNKTSRRVLFVTDWLKTLSASLTQNLSTMELKLRK